MRRNVLDSFERASLLVDDLLLFDVFLIAGGHFVVMTNLYLVWINDCLNDLSVKG